MSKLAVVPGLYGQYKLLKNELLPFIKKTDDVIYMGNIVGTAERVRDNSFKGPNHSTIELIERTVYGNPHTILMGANEMVALNDPTRFVSTKSLLTLQRWWLEKEHTAQIATVRDNILFTHAGLTHGEWLSIGKPMTAQETADRLNEKYEGTLYQGDCYNMSGKLNMGANPLFADPYRELYPSWIGREELPFTQAHATFDLNTYVATGLRNDPMHPISHLGDIQYTKYGSCVFMGDHAILGIDLQIDRDKILKELKHRNILILENDSEAPAVDVELPTMTSATSSPVSDKN